MGPLPGSRPDNQSRKEENTRSSLKIPTLSPLSSLTATPRMSVPTPAKLTTNSVRLSTPPKSSLKIPPRLRKDHQTPPSKLDPLSPSLPPSVETPNQRSAGPRTAKMSTKTITLPTTSMAKPPSSPSPTSPRRMLANTRCTVRTTKDSTTPSPPSPSHNSPPLPFFLVILSSSLHLLLSATTSFLFCFHNNYIL